MTGIFKNCPGCGSSGIVFQELSEGGSREYCSTCLFVANYVKFTCGHCNADIFAFCPKKDCGKPGTPTNRSCPSP